MIFQGLCFVGIGASTNNIQSVIAVFLFFLNRDCAVKFNDYFEFPRQFDMEPFTTFCALYRCSRVLSNNQEDISLGETKLTTDFP